MGGDGSTNLRSQSRMLRTQIGRVRIPLIIPLHVIMEKFKSKGVDTISARGSVYPEHVFSVNAPSTSSG